MPLKNIALFVLFAFAGFIARSQEPVASYGSSWKRIDSLITKNGQTRTALNEVNEIYRKAKKDKNETQVIKSLIYRLQLNQQLSENADNENIEFIKKEIKTARQPALSILNSIAAGYYYSYLQRNRYSLYSRTALQNDTSTDIGTAGLATLHKKISAYYRASVYEEDILKKTSLAPYDAIINKGNARDLRPTLFDLLAHRALDYFRNDERDITRPAYAFEIDDSMAFASAKDFAAHVFTTADSTSLHYRALDLFRKLIAFHLNDKNKDALTDVDVERLEFVRQYSTLADKDARYEMALRHLATDNGPVVAWYLLAELHASRAAGYDPLQDSSGRYEYNVAEALCLKALAGKKTAEGWVPAQNLLDQIRRKQIRMEAELVNVPGLPFRVLLSYRNMDHVFLRMVKVNRKIKEQLGDASWDEKFWQQVTALPVIKTLDFQVPATHDHQYHRVELPVDGLPAGEYALIGSPAEGYPLNNNMLALQYFYVSNISYVRNENEYYVLNRSTGAPLPSAKLQLWQFSYKNSQRHSSKLAGPFAADKNGYISVPEGTVMNSQSYFPEFSCNNDKLFIEGNAIYYYQSGEQEYDEQDDKTFLFTDRSLYRPGQTVYFKGIVIRAGKKPALAVKREAMVYLYDQNREVIDSLNVVTNAYGSYSGKFTIPTGLLNGSFSIVDDENEGQAGFNVEEYKRPKFEVALEKPAGSYRVNDSIRVPGNAQGYAGNAIDKANVKYRIVRRYNRIYDFVYRSKIFPPVSREQVEIANGTTTTDKSGAFFVSFKAIPDEKIPAAQNPVFNYDVIVDVTDATGETRSTQSTLSISYHAIKLDLTIPENMACDSFRTLAISSSNSNELFESVRTTVEIIKLNAPQKVFRERYWEQPDQFILSRDEYYTRFPYDLYSNENDMTKWTQDKKVVSTVFLTKKDSSLTLPELNCEPGWYEIKISARDKFNDSIGIKKYVQLYSNSINSPIATSIIDGNQKPLEPGDKWSYRILTNLDSIYLIRELSKQNQQVERKIFPPGKNPVAASIDIKAADKGGLEINTFFVKNNRVYTRSFHADVPFFDKQLRIEYLSFREKTLPGSTEKWKVKISGMHAEKVSAELLTSMYDASLDQFAPHSWTIPSLWTSTVLNSDWMGTENFMESNAQVREFYRDLVEENPKSYDQLAVNEMDGSRIMVRGMTSLQGRLPGLQSNADLDEVVVAGYGIKKKEELPAPVVESKNPPSPIPPVTVQPRKNLQETAFFFPELHTDSEGNVEFSFTSPEALTTWKWMILAHTKEMAFGYSEKMMVTQKQLMVQPNPPRFLRQGDQMELSSKVVNITGKPIRGKATLELTDALTGKNIDGLFANANSSQTINIGPNQSIPVFYSIRVPENFNDPVTWRIIATGQFLDSVKAVAGISDGEEAILPVISNRKLVTETLPLPVKLNQTNTFSFGKLLNSGQSKTLQQSQLVVEFTSNPAWYAVQALPYMAEGEKENAEAVFNRFYANSLASMIANGSPHFREVLEKWRTTDTASLMSNLQKNEELKSVLLQETPWVLEAKTEAQQKRNVAILFEAYTLSENLASSLEKLESMQSPSGAFVWYAGGPEDRYMTQYIAAGIGRLKRLGAVTKGALPRLDAVAGKAISYLDMEIASDFRKIKGKKEELEDHLDNLSIQYLYMRSLFPQVAVPGNTFSAYHYFRNQSAKYWIGQNIYMRGMIALSLFRTGDKLNAAKIMRSLKETAINNKELGMYWKENNGGYHWFEAPVETQSLMIEAFSEVSQDAGAVNGLKTWLLKNKQTNAWKTTKATADACYALLLQGTDWTSAQPEVSISLGDTTIHSVKQKTEAGSGYFKAIIPAASVKPAMGKINVSTVSAGMPGEQPAWGAVYWQYFEDLDKITSSATPLTLSRKLFLVQNPAAGPVLQQLDEKNTVRVGDKVKVRIELRADREMEYVHMQDMRGACMEPVNVISGYKYQDGLGYYESTKDASTNFYFGYLPKGVFVFEYELTVTHSGTFSNGITTIQCMYAPEFSSHSEGIQVKVEKQ